MKTAGRIKKIIGSAVFTVILVMIIVAVAIYVYLLRSRDYISEAKAYVDGTIETGSNAVDNALSQYADSTPASVIVDQELSEADNLKASIGFVFVGLTEDITENHTIIELLKNNDIKAAFALSGAEVIENDDELSEITAARFTVVSNGTNGETGLQSLSREEAVRSMLISREDISGATDSQVDLLYPSASRITNELLREANLSGYKAVIMAEDKHIIDAESFENPEAASSFTDSLAGKTVVVVNLRGKAADIQDEDQVVMEKPAVDKQAGLDDSRQDDAEEESETAFSTKLEWLINAVNSRSDVMTTAYIDSFTSVSGAETLSSEAADPEADTAALYSSCLTSEEEIGLGFVISKGADNAKAVNEVSARLNDIRSSNSDALIFLSTEQAKDRKLITGITDNGGSFGVYMSYDELKGRKAPEIYEILRTVNDALSNEDGYRSIFVFDELSDYDTLHAVKASAKLLGIRLTIPSNPDEVSKGALYCLDISDTQALSRLKEQAALAKLQISDIYSVIDRAGTLDAMPQTKLKELRRDNDSKLAAEHAVYTTEAATGFVFYGLGLTPAVIDAADTVNAYGGKATFFATLSELQSCQTAIEYVLAQGNDIGICYKADAGYPQKFNAIADYIDSWQQYAAWRYNTAARTIYAPNDKLEDETREAISAMNCEIVKTEASVVRNEDAAVDPQTAEEALGSMDALRVMRGELISFKLDFYNYDKNARIGNTAAGAMLKGFIEKHIDTLAYRSYATGEIEDESRFALKTAEALLASEKMYEFNTGSQTDISLDRNALSSMQDDNERFTYIKDHYIGTSFVTNSRKLPGFTKSEIKKLDKVGRFTKDKVLFLTFDDWGTEESINELLYVLRKYGVKATFFVTTQHVDSNPNMLRAIACEGHQIGSHTDTHYRLANTQESGKSNISTTLTEEELAEFRQDIVTSYDKLYKYTGDVNVDGRPALTRFFRPPTLAVSKAGISTVFDVGFTYCISGDMSTDDYKAKDYDDMLKQLAKGISDGGDFIKVRDGSVIVMHMLENARYTAQALDTMIPIWQSQGYSFARLDDYLQ